MNKRLWIIFAVVVILALGALIWWKNLDDRTSGAKYVNYLNGKKLITMQSVVDARNKAANGGQLANNFTLSPDERAKIIPDHFLGDKTSQVIVIEYEDFACSACNGFASKAGQIHQDYKDRVLFIYRHFNIGQNTSTLSESAALATYLLTPGDDNAKNAAFWRMHDLIFSDQTCMEGNNKQTCQARLELYAKQLGLDAAKFREALTNYQVNGIKDKIDRDQALGLAMSNPVSATPTWYVNGEKIEGANDSKIRAAIDKALK